jgi:hypothetical protein
MVECFLIERTGEYVDHGIAHLPLYCRVGGHVPFLLRDAMPGAMWDADWMPDRFKGPDGRCLVVVCPDGYQWMIDGQASNCTRPDDSEHKCWVRHGEPPNITVDKNGNTCQAGGGSIGTSGYHGFLRDGSFTPNLNGGS